jgi:hypothetical protein
MRSATVTSVFVSAALLLRPHPASAAPPWVERSLTMPAGTWAFDGAVGAGIITNGGPKNVGIDLEAGFGIADRIEVGARLSGDSVAQAAPNLYGTTPRGNADNDARLFDRATFDQGPTAIANPELRLRGAILRDAVGEMALEARIVAPLAKYSGAGIAFGVPVAFHLGDVVRIDAGAYEVFVGNHDELQFTDSGGLQPASVPDDFLLEAPVAIWFQCTPAVWLGPIGSIRYDTHFHQDFPQQPWSGSGGIALGLQLGDALDVKADVLGSYLYGTWSSAGVAIGVEWRPSL